VSEQALRLTSSDGLRLEAALWEPRSPSAAVVLCHPHPRQGGTMNAPLLLALRDDFVERGYVVLRFNFRGIGSSEGTSSLGVDEVADAEGAVAEIRSRLTDLPLAVLGWSFGAAVALRLAARDGELAGCVAIAPSVSPKPGVSAGLPSADEMELDVPVLVVCAANDRVVDPSDCAGWGKAAYAEVVVVDAANHFFWGKYDRLKATVGDWLAGVL
jgi:alpha/beta superfamily hydrolase